MKSQIKNSILITNAHERSARSAIQSLKKAGYKTIISTSQNSLHLLKSIKEILLHPCPSQETLHFENWLIELVKKDNGLFVLPINEAVIHCCETIRLNTPKLAARFIMPSNNSLKYALSKFHATQSAQTANIKTPKTYFIKNATEKSVHFPSEVLDYPLILKWDNFLFEGKYNKGSLRFVQNRVELEDTVMELLPYNCNIILQEFVPGHGVGAFFLRQQGKIVLRFAHKRIHEVPYTGGVSAYCESSDDISVLEQGEKLLESIDYNGLAMVEFRKVEGKTPVFLEINGRLWGSSGLAYAAGADFSKAMVEYHLNGFTTVDQPDLKKKIKWHEPRFEILYLHSIKSAIVKNKEHIPDLLKARKKVLLNFINPAVKSDWWTKNNVGSSLKFYLGIVKSGFLKIRDVVLKDIKADIDPLVLKANERVKDFFPKNKKINHILFVCYGNICRSPYAEFRWNQFHKEHTQLPQANSVGFHDNIDRLTPIRFQSVANHLGVNLESHRSKRITKLLVERSDVLIVMDLRNLIDVQNKFPEAMYKTILLGAVTNKNESSEIEDPYGTSIGTGGSIYRRMDDHLNNLKNILLK